MIDPVAADSKFAECAKILSRRSTLFNQLRKALRLKPEPHASERDVSRSVEEKISELEDICKNLEGYKEFLLESRPQRGPGQDMRQAID